MCSTNPGGSDDNSSAEVCNGLDDDCDASTDEGGDALCADTLWCNGDETCGGVSGCLAGTAPDCSANDLPEVAACFFDPDDFGLTWDYFAGFTSACNEGTDSCNVYGGSNPWTNDITHMCNATCGAECVVDNDCGLGSYCDACACRLYGDVNGDDNVDVLDLTQAAAAFGSDANNSNWDVSADVWPAKTGDGIIDESDLEFIDSHYGSKPGAPVCQGGLDDLTVNVLPSGSKVAGKVSLGGNVSVQIDIATAIAIYAGEVRLSYNASVLDMTSVSEGNFLSAGIGPDNTFEINRTNGTAGTVVFASSRMGDVPEVNGSGSFEQLTFKTVGKGVSALNIYDSLMLMKNLTEVEADVVNGSVEVVDLPGDANRDCEVGLIDLVSVAIAYNSSPGNSTWNPLADFNGDGKISIVDLATVGINYDETC